MITIGVLCRNTQNFIETIEHMIENKCINRDSITTFSKQGVILREEVEITPIIINSPSSRGMRYNLIIPEYQMPHIITHQSFHETAYSYARLKETVKNDNKD